MKRSRSLVGLCALFVVLSLAMTACRTSQQARRNQSTAAGRIGQSNGRDYDSLLLVEKRLVDVIDSMTSLIESDHSRIHALEQEVALLRARIESRSLPPTGGQAFNAPAATPQSSLLGPAPTMPPPTTPGTLTAQQARDRYAAALRLFNENSYEAALDAFRQLMAEDPNGMYTPNYGYWAGESLYALRRYTEALQSFNDVVQRYPNSAKADDAAFKIGESYERMNLRSSARSAYERLITDYPKSEYHARAEARIKALR